MNVKMVINSQLSTTESRKQTKQTSRTETESKYGDHLKLGEGSWRGKVENGGKDTGINKYKLIVTG